MILSRRKDYSGEGRGLAEDCGVFAGSSQAAFVLFRGNWGGDLGKK